MDHATSARPGSLARALASIAILTTLIGVARADEPKADPGFKLLFNGKDYTGWKTKAGQALDGKAESPERRFKIKDGLMVIDAKVKGDITIYTTNEFSGEAHLKFDFKPETGCNNDLFFRGLKFDLKKEDVKNWKLGEWNTFEIVVKAGKAEFKCNGESIKTMAVKGEKSNLGVRAELGPMEIRNLQIKSGE